MALMGTGVCQVLMEKRCDRTRGDCLSQRFSLEFYPSADRKGKPSHGLKRCFKGLGVLNTLLFFMSSFHTFANKIIIKPEGLDSRRAAPCPGSQEGPAWACLPWQAGCRGAGLCG